MVYDVPDPRPAPGEALIDVERVGLCGTDVEFFTGEMAYLHMGVAAYPMRLGHEWCGTVVAVGADTDAAWVGRRVTGDTMLGCGTCARCRTGRQHVCADRTEVGIRGGRPGALAEQLTMPVTALLALPDAVDPVAGALVEPGGNALRAVDATGLEAVGSTSPGRLLVIGSGTIGLLCAVFARSRGIPVWLAGQDPATLDLARTMGFPEVGAVGDVRGSTFDAVIDATNNTTTPQLAVDLVEPGGRVVLIGLAGEPSLLDARTLTLNDVTAVGILSASPGLAATIAAYADGSVDPRPLVAATIGLEEVAQVLSGGRPAEAGPGPKVHVDPRL